MSPVSNISRLWETRPVTSSIGLRVVFLKPFPIISKYWMFVPLYLGLWFFADRRHDFPSELENITALVR